jgi:hypothetical protein
MRRTGSPAMLSLIAWFFDEPLWDLAYGDTAEG